MAGQDYTLTQDQVEHFMRHGWIKLSNCFSLEQAAELQATLWTRLGMDPDDKSTWHTERTNMPWHRAFSIESFAPKAWAGICGLLGGAERVNPDASTWKDSFIVNLGTPEKEGQYTAPEDLINWHSDGDFFVHYLDSPEQALLVIPLWSDVPSNGGGTMICPPAIKILAKHMYEHPEGVSPRMTPRGENPQFKREDKGLKWYCDLAKQIASSSQNDAHAKEEEAFVEVTGTVGDVYLLHPLMLHSATHNSIRHIRVITNPPVSLREPFDFDRSDSNYSIVERKTLQVLGKESLRGWKITGKREGIVPARVTVQMEMKRKEAERLKGLGVGVEEREIKPEAVPWRERPVWSE